jgi:hypothetical protein
MDGWLGGALPWLPTCDINMPSPAVMPPENGPSATDGWMGGVLPWLPSCGIATSSPAVTLLELAVTETGGSELCHTGHYKTRCKVDE